MSYGTENRSAEKFVPANPKVWPFIKFRGSDIRDLHVHKPGEQQEDDITFGTPEPPAPAPAAKPRAPPAASAPSNAGANWTQGPPPINPQAAARAATLAPARAAAAPQAQQQGGPGGKGNNNNNNPGGKGAYRNNNNTNPGGKGNAAALPGMGASLANRRVRGGTGQGAFGDVSGEFDFASFNAAFDKDAEKAALLGSQQHQPVVKKYDPSASFFDEISCDSLERSKAAASGAVQTERAKNTETFGATSLQEARRRGGGANNNRGDRENQAPSSQGKAYGQQGKGQGGSSAYQNKTSATPAGYGPPPAYGNSYQQGQPSGGKGGQQGRNHGAYAAPSHQPAPSHPPAPAPVRQPAPAAPAPKPQAPPKPPAPVAAFHAPPPPPPTGAPQKTAANQMAPGEFQPARRQRNRPNKAATGEGAQPKYTSNGGKGSKGGKGKGKGAR